MIYKIKIEHKSQDPIEFHRNITFILEKINRKIYILTMLLSLRNIKFYNIEFIISIIINYKISIFKIYDINICKINVLNSFEIHSEIEILKLLRKRIEIYQANQEYLNKIKLYPKLNYENISAKILETIEDCHNILDIIFTKIDSVKYHDILKNTIKTYEFKEIKKIHSRN